MMRVLHGSTRRLSADGAMFRVAARDRWLDSPYGRQLLARIDAATSEHVVGVDRAEHVRRIALVCLNAKLRARR